MIKLKRLKINRYRNVEPCDLVFGDRFNILLGPNGAGKTTLLNLISKVLRTNLGDTSDPFSIEVELAFPGGTLSGKVETFNETTTETPQGFLDMLREDLVARSGISQTQRVPLLEVQIISDTPRSTVTIRRTEVGTLITVDDGSSHTNVPLGVLGRGALFHGMLRIATPDSWYMAGFTKNDIANVARFDESLDGFRALTARQDDTALISAEFRPHIQHLVYQKGSTRFPEKFAYSVDNIAPPSLTQLLEKSFTDKATEFSFGDTDLTFLAETCRLLGLRSSVAKLELTEKRTSERLRADIFEFGNLKFWFTRKDGSIFQDQHLSYGQKRLLTFLYYLECNPSIVIADELVNGLHHAWIKECMEAIGERQAFLTSQNPLLLDYLFFTSVQEVKESFILCRTEAVGNSEKMIWRNLTDDEAAMFYSAYKVGIEHVGEILRTRGLW